MLSVSFTVCGPTSDVTEMIRFLHSAPRADKPRLLRDFFFTQPSLLHILCYNRSLMSLGCHTQGGPGQPPTADLQHSKTYNMFNYNMDLLLWLCLTKLHYKTSEGIRSHWSPHWAHLHLIIPGPVVTIAGSNQVMELVKGGLSQRVWTLQLRDLWLLCHVMWWHSRKAFISAMLALLCLNFSDSPPAIWLDRQEPAQATREFTL